MDRNGYLLPDYQSILATRVGVQRSSLMRVFMHEPRLVQESCSVSLLDDHLWPAWSQIVLIDP